MFLVLGKDIDEKIHHRMEFSLEKGAEMYLDVILACLETHRKQPEKHANIYEQLKECVSFSIEEIT